jgi:hypothetical protein
VQKKRNNEKLTRRKTSFSNLQNIFFFFFLLFGPLLSNLITFLFLIHFKRFKMLWEHHLKFYKSFLNSNSKRVTYKEHFGCLRTNLCSVQWFVFFEFLTPFTLGGHNFLISNPFLTILTVLDAPRGGLQTLFGRHK